MVVPTKNAARTLRACLESIARQSVRCGLVVDRGSVDDSKSIASGFADLVLNAAPNRSLQRNAGALPADIRLPGRSTRPDKIIPNKAVAHPGGVA